MTAQEQPRRRYNADQSRQDILESAEREFAEKGYYGARVQAIADQAKINKRMIYEYYSSKDLLYQAVLSDVYNRLTAEEQHLIDRSLQGVDLIQAIIDLYFDFFEKNPAFVSILLWENLNRVSHLQGMPHPLERPTSRLLLDELQRGQTDGWFRRDLDMTQTAVSLVLMSFANFSFRHTLTELLHVDLYTEEGMRIRKKHTLDLFLSHITASSQSEQAR